MHKLIKDTPIGIKLPVVMTMLVAATILAMSVASILLIRNIASNNAATLLESTGRGQAKVVNELLRDIERDLRIRAGYPGTTNALIALADGYQSLEAAEETLQRIYIHENPHPLGEREKLVEADTGSSYGFIHAIYHPSFEALQKEMEYYDVFLIDPEGNLVYSVFKEFDFATNLVTGPWKDSGLAQAFAAASMALESDPAIFVDFAPYTPSADAPAAFVARPVFNDAGDRLGVLAYQMPISELNSAINDVSALGQTADGFIIGDDYMMRTESLLIEGDDILKHELRNDAVTAALNGTAGLYSYTTDTAHDVSAYMVPIDFLGTRWVAVVQQDQAELFAPVMDMKIQQLVLAALIFLATVAIAIFASRAVAKPIQRLTASVDDIAKGDYAQAVPEVERGDEIGALARATEIFRQNAIGIEKMRKQQELDAKQMASMAQEREKAAAQELKLSQEREAADRARAAERQEMMQKLGASFGTVVSAAISGQFSGRVEANFDDPTLNDLAKNINALLQSIDTNLTLTGSVMERIAGGDLTAYLEGDLKGSFADLQTNVNAMVAFLQKLIGDISESSASLSSSSGGLRATSDNLSRQAEQNAASLEEASASLEEITNSVRQVNQNIAEATANAKTVRQSAEKGEEISADLSQAMDRIAEGSKKISQVVNVIDDIAFQINLLALNAGVEAARAGDAGRGFAVVASEVRSLAQKAATSVRDIANVISQSDAAVTEGVETVAQAKSSLQNISEGVVVIAHSFEEVSAAISDQANGIQEVSISVTQIDRRSQSQSASFEDVSKASLSLSNQAQLLEELTTRFNTSKQGAMAPKQRIAMAS